MVQDKQLSTSQATRNLPKLLWVVKLIVTLLVLAYIFRTFQNEQKGAEDVVSVLLNIVKFDNAAILIATLLLVPVNWALESKKWQLLASKVTPVSFKDAFRGTLTGLAIGVAAPAQLGDTVGRIAVLKTNKRLEAVGAAVVSNGIQFYVAVLMGGIGWIMVSGGLNLPVEVKSTIEWVLAATIILGLIVVPMRKKLTDHSWGKWSKVQSYFKVIGIYSFTELLTATAIGAARYIVFLSQFVLILSLFHFPVSIPELAACVALIFLAKTLIPAINVFGDLGLREFTALIVFESYNLPPEQIITATFLVWIVNVLGPIIVGIFMVWKYKWGKTPEKPTAE